MIDSSLALYKLMILYLLQQTALPLSPGQISAFVVGQDYMTWFRMQEALTDLVGSGLVTAGTDPHMTYYEITEDGLADLKYLLGDLSAEFREDVRSYLQANGYEIRSEAGVTANYRYLASEGYVVDCAAAENGVPVIELKLHVPNEAAAQKACDRWKREHAAVYLEVVQRLL